MTAAPKDPIDHLPTREGYDRWASIYDDEGNALIALEEPLFHELLGGVQGLSVLDLGCGTGRHALRCAAAGAEVTAIDFSEEMLARARTKPGGERVRFVHHDLARPLPFPDHAFDRVLSGLVLDHVADLTGFCREACRVCASSGLVVLSVMHPALKLKGVQARFVDPETGRETRPRSEPWELSDYVLAVLRAGLTIEHLSEHAADEALAARVPRAARYVGWPMAVLIRARA